MSEPFEHPLNNRLAEIAMAYPETTAGDSCVNRGFKAGGKKNFLFLGVKDDQVRVMLKLDESAKDAASSDIGDVSVGNAGWVTALLSPDAAADEVLEQWIDESWRLMAPKKLLRAHESAD